MKKRMLMIIAVMLAGAVLTACSGGAGGGVGGDTEGASQKYDVEIYTGSQGGGFMTAGAMFSDQWQKDIPGFYGSTLMSGGSFNNAILIEQSESPLIIGLVFNTVLSDALAHEGDFAEKTDGPLEDMAAMARLNRQSLFLAPTLKSAVPAGVTSVGEFLATHPKITLYTKERGSGGEIATRKLLEAAGYSYDSFAEWGGKVTYSSTSDGVAAVVDGHAEAVWQSYVPHAADLQELESSRDIVYLQVEQEIVDALLKSGYNPFLAPADWFSSTDEPINTFMEDTTVVCHKDMPEELVYQMTKTLLQNKEKWEVGQTAFESFEPENACKSTVVPLHPGAERAYRELGYMP
jgi:TRAP transporter TAXI family solute receptor